MKKFVGGFALGIGIGYHGKRGANDDPCSKAHYRKAYPDDCTSFKTTPRTITYNAKPVNVTQKLQTQQNLLANELIQTLCGQNGDHHCRYWSKVVKSLDYNDIPGTTDDDIAHCSYIQELKDGKKAALSRIPLTAPAGYQQTHLNKMKHSAYDDAITPVFSELYNIFQKDDWLKYNTSYLRTQLSNNSSEHVLKAFDKIVTFWRDVKTYIDDDVNDGNKDDDEDELRIAYAIDFNKEQFTNLYLYVWEPVAGGKHTSSSLHRTSEKVQLSPTITRVVYKGRYGSKYVKFNNVMMRLGEAKKLCGKSKDNKLKTSRK